MRRARRGEVRAPGRRYDVDLYEATSADTNAPALSRTSDSLRAKLIHDRRRLPSLSLADRMCVGRRLIHSWTNIRDGLRPWLR